MKDFYLNFTFFNLTTSQVEIVKKLHEANTDEYFHIRFVNMYSENSDNIKSCKESIEEYKKLIEGLKNNEYYVTGDEEVDLKFLALYEEFLKKDYEKLIELYEKEEILHNAEIQYNNYKHSKIIQEMKG